MMVMAVRSGVREGEDHFTLASFPALDLREGSEPPKRGPRDTLGDHVKGDRLQSLACGDDADRTPFLNYESHHCDLLVPCPLAVPPA